MAGMACPVCRIALAARYDRRFRGNQACDFSRERPMSALRAEPVQLTASERAALKKRGRGHKTAHRDRQRALIVLLAARGRPNAKIAAGLGVSEDTVRKWRGRFAARRLPGLEDLPRTGRPRRISAAERAEVCALACQLPAATGVPLARWSCPELATELTSRGLVSGISPSSVRRILAEHPIKPWQYQSWIFPRDPDFAAKAKVILDLYQGFYQGRPLRPGDRIVSVDAKPSIQARDRRHRPAPPGPGQPMRVEHEYQRKGALALLGALDVRTGTVFASTPPTTGIVPFMALMGQVMSQEPYSSASRVFVIVDNGSDHRGKKAARRLRDAYPNCVMIHTPVHASWLNQIEILFSIVQKKVVSPNDFTSTSQLSATLMAFIDRHNQTARPFNWKFTAKDLAGLLERISAHQEPARQPDSLPEAA
jgi:transposase